MVHRRAWNDLIRLYETDQRRRGLIATSITTRTRILNQLARQGHAPFAVTADHLNDWLDDPAKSMDTRRAYLSGVAGFYRWAIRADLTTTNPVDKVTRPRRRKRLPRPIHVEHLNLALTHATPILRCWLLLGCLGGLRCHEIAGLDRSDVLDHLPNPMIWVRHGKGDKERTVPAHPDLLAALRAAGLPARGPLFVTAEGRRYRPDAVSKRLNRHLHGLGIAATAHQLRHRFGTDVYAESRDLRMTQELLGHSDPATTALYAAWSPEEAIAVVHRLGRRDAVQRHPAGKGRRQGSEQEEAASA